MGSGLTDEDAARERAARRAELERREAERSQAVAQFWHPDIVVVSPVGSGSPLWELRRPGS